VTQRLPRPVVVTVHDIIPYLLRDDESLSVYKGRTDRFFDALAMKGLAKADHLVADSAYTKMTLVDALGIEEHRIEVVHLGIDFDRFRPEGRDKEPLSHHGLRSDRRYLIYVGSEDPRKNVATLIRALAGVRIRHTDVELIKVGKAHFENERSLLISLATDLGIRASIHFLDEVSEEDLPRLYQVADVCVMPSLYEGFGFPVLEAMACGTPVVSSNASSLPELVGDAAILFDPRHGAEQELARRIDEVLSSDTLRTRMKMAGVEQAAKFTWDRTVRQMADIYSKLATGTPASTDPQKLTSSKGRNYRTEVSQSVE
jgi:glycosyltransferase involved in cell wall biosynthesis